MEVRAWVRGLSPLFWLLTTQNHIYIFQQAQPTFYVDGFQKRLRPQRNEGVGSNIVLYEEPPTVTNTNPDNPPVLLTLSTATDDSDSNQANENWFQNDDNKYWHDLVQIFFVTWASLLSDCRL